MGGRGEDGQGDSQRREEVNNAWRCLVDTHTHTHTRTLRASAEGNCSSARRDVSPPFVWSPGTTTSPGTETQFELDTF